MTLTYGELFAGYGGAGLAIESFFGDAKPLWFSEIEPGPCAVLAHHWPGVPNLGDIATINFAEVPRVDLLHSSFPCTDVSSAGRKAGLNNTRSGLWAHTVRAIDALRPSLVTIENVRGLLSTRTGGGDATDGDMESRTGAMGNAAGRSAQRAAGTVLGDLADLGYDAVWTTVAASDVGAAHQRKRVFILAYPAESDRIGRRQGPDESVSVEAPLAPIGSDALLLPSPVAHPSGNPPEVHLRKKLGRSRMTDLGIIVEIGLLETGGLLPTMRAAEASQTMGAPGAARHVAAGNGGLTETIGVFLPTIRSTDANGAGAHGNGGPDLRTVASTIVAQSWGKYEPAIRRAELALGRSAPAPTELNRNGRPRLSARFGEWHMMLPEGHVTDLSHAEVRKPTKNGWVVATGLTRSEQLKMLGNGIVPPQMVLALSILYPLIGIQP